MEYFFHKSPWWIVGLYTPPPLDSDSAGHRRGCPGPFQRAPLSGMGVDGQQAAVEPTPRLDHCIVRGCFFDEEVVLFDYTMQRPLGARGTLFLSFEKQE
jgi:hypothetical protein